MRARPTCGGSCVRRPAKTAMSLKKDRVCHPMAKAKSDLPAKLRVGCSGWGYDDWLGGFYPEGTPKSDYLKLYSNTFDVVEVDSSYYRIPQPAMTATWRRTVPDGFLFTAKFPKKITHEKKLVHVEDP
ncbi:MAG: DUF72 domain-containing protein, partial [Methanobacteriota archaeon]